MRNKRTAKTKQQRMISKTHAARHIPCQAQNQPENDHHGEVRQQERARFACNFQQPREFTTKAHYAITHIVWSYGYFQASPGGSHENPQLYICTYPDDFCWLVKKQAQFLCLFSDRNGCRLLAGFLFKMRGRGNLHRFIKVWVGVLVILWQIVRISSATVYPHV